MSYPEEDGTALHAAAEGGAIRKGPYGGSSLTFYLVGSLWVEEIIHTSSDLYSFPVPEKPVIKHFLAFFTKLNELTEIPLSFFPSHFPIIL